MLTKRVRVGWFERHFKPELFSTTRYQFVFCVAVVLLSILFLIRPVVQFYPIGKAPRLQEVTDEVIKSWGKEPVRVKTGLIVKEFLKFDSTRNEFIINALVWFAYDPASVSLDVLDKFSFTKGEFVERSKPHVKKIDKHTNQATYFVRIKFSTVLNYKRFPLNDHRLFLSLTNNAFSAEDILFDVDPMYPVATDAVYISGWSVVGSTAKSGYSKTQLGQSKLYRPKVVFSVDVSKHDIRQLILIFLPLIFFFYFGLFSFSMTQLALSLRLILTGLSGLITYMIVIEGMVPNVGYFMLSDFLMIFFLCALFIVLLFHGMTIIFADKLSQDALKRLAGWAVLILNSALLIVWFYLTNLFGLW